MSAFDDRERAFEAKFARDQDALFRITARDLRFVGMDNNGLSFDVNFSAYNANTFELDIREQAA